MQLETTRFTQALLDLEDDEPDVLFEILPGAAAPLWPQVRMGLAYALSAEEFTSVSVASRDSLATSLLRAGRAFLPSRWDASRLQGRSPLTYFTGGVTVAATPEGERNWLIGDFAETFADESAILQWRALPSANGHPVFRRTRTLDPLIARAEVRTRLRPPPSVEPRVRALVREFARLLGGAISDARLEPIIASASYGARIAGDLERQLDAVLDRLRPRIVLFDSPVDGGWGSVIAQMKARGIHVVEPQHGWIGPGHGAYNFGAAMSRPELRAAIPDELLTFGRFWSESVRYGGEVTTIGKPHFERAVEAAPPIEDRAREVLVVSSVGEPDRTSDFVLSLAEALPRSWSVRFRPHPSERHSCLERYPRLIASPKVMIDERTDVYESLAASRLVVGVASTVLFEAAGMGCGVFVRNTPYVPYIVGDLFGVPLSERDGIDRVVATAQHWVTSAGASTSDATTFWEPNAIANFRRWVQDRAALSTSPEKE